MKYDTIICSIQIHSELFEFKSSRTKKKYVLWER